MDFKSYGHTFTVNDPYTEGHALTLKEATALNRLRAEFISHKVRAKAFEGLKAGDTPTQEQIDAANAVIQEQETSFEFGAIRTGESKPKATPVEMEARKLAAEQVKAVIAQNSMKLQTAAQAKAAELPEGTYPRARFDEKVAEYALAETIVAKAKKIVAARKKAPEVELEIAL